jgi:hypothetical protein
MQENIKLVIYTIVGLFVLWFIAMTVNRNIFLHSDIDGTFYGTVAMNKTDIGEQCGSETSNNFEMIEYKLNQKDQIIYLCPQGLWPIQKTVIAVNVSDDLRRTFSPAVFAKINAIYPPVATVAAPTLNTAAPPVEVPTAAATAVPATQQQAPDNSPARLIRPTNPRDIRTATPPQSAAPQTENANPFIQPGTQAPATASAAAAPAP